MFRLATILTAAVAVMVLMTVLAAQEAGEGKVVKLQGGTDIPVEKIFEHITEITGRDFVVAPNILGRMCRVSKDMEANLEILQSLLRLNGLYLQVVTAGGRTFYKALTDRDLRTLRYEAGRIYSERDKLPAENVFVMVPVTVMHIDASQVERTLTNRLADRQGPGSVISIGHNMLILKDFAPMVAHYVRIIREIDKPAPTECRIVELKHANPDEIVSSLKKSADSDKLEGVFPDTRNGRLVISGEPSELDNLEKVIKALDTEAGERAPALKIHTLEHAASHDMAKMINSLLSETEKKRGFVASSAGSPTVLVVRADRQLQEQLEKLIEAIDALQK